MVGLLLLVVPRLNKHSLLHGLQVTRGGLIRASGLPVTGAWVLVLLYLRRVSFMRLDRSLLHKVALHTGFYYLFKYIDPII